ncbi:hypothetical protein [Falsiphaeobacter marinintestinus]|uniref:hypothetical protein n=1 Tax=Falsiphaeobacter marinintestinus TaxID=1492905 RepID=UPI0011B4EE91|nr:hypothetical protein [Phaeobacter marinintestinus]
MTDLDETLRFLPELPFMIQLRITGFLRAKGSDVGQDPAPIGKTGYSAIRDANGALRVVTADDVATFGEWLPALLALWAEGKSAEGMVDQLVPLMARQRAADMARAAAATKSTRSRFPATLRPYVRKLANDAWQEDPTRSLATVGYLVADALTSEGADALGTDKHGRPNPVPSENSLRDWVRDLRPPRN